MISSICSLFLLHLLLLLHNLSSFAQILPIVDPDGSNATAYQIYVVHLDKPDGLELISPEDREKWYTSFLPNTTLDSGEPRLVFSYHLVITGFAARLTHEEAKAMESMHGFLAADPDELLTLQTTYTPRFLELEKYGKSIWKMSDQGKGVIIGVIDSGIIPDHASFGDDGMDAPPIKWRGCCQFKVAKCNPYTPSICNNKLIGARSVWPAKSPIDKIGHGTHVSSTVAGNFVYGAHVLDQAQGTASGVAPKSHLALYHFSLLDKKGFLEFSGAALVKAFEFAIDDGVDVLSISMGVPTATTFDESSVVLGTFPAMYHKGILSSCAAGNYGALFNNSLINDAPWILTVGASSIDRVALATVKLGNGMEFDGESAYQLDDFGSQMYTLEYPGTAGTAEKKICLSGSLDDLDVKGKIVLCGNGFTDDVNKSEVVKAAGGAGLIVLNQAYDAFTVSSFPNVIPTAHVNHEDALKIVNYFETSTSQSPTATIIFKGTQFSSRLAPAVASFSSRGPSLVNGGIIKPDIIGPGVDILGAWHTTVGPGGVRPSTSTYNFASGTSMATPHLGGVVALIKSVHPEWSHAAIKSAIMTTAHKLDRDGNPITDEKSRKPASFFAMGSGLVNPPGATDPGLVYDIHRDDYIGYLCGLFALKQLSMRQIKKITNQNVLCSPHNEIYPEELNYPSILVSLDSSPTKTITRRVTNVAVATSQYQAKIIEPEGVNVVVSPSTLQFFELDETLNYTVEFSKTGKSPIGGEYSEGELAWVFDNYVVRSPIAVKF